MLKIGAFESLYTEDVHFEDPAHALQGRKTLMDYFASMFKNLDSCSFKFHQSIIGDTDIFLLWTMFISHPKLCKGETIRVEGGSHLRTRHVRIFYHRDYFDIELDLTRQLRWPLELSPWGSDSHCVLRKQKKG